MKLNLILLTDQDIQYQCRNYKSSDIKQACDGVNLAIVCLGTGIVSLSSSFTTGMKKLEILMKHCLKTC